MSSEKLQESVLYDKQYTGATGAGITETIDCRRSNYVLESLLLGVGFTFSLGAGDSAAMRAFAPGLFTNTVTLIGQRDANSDVFVNTSGMDLLWDETTDSGYYFPELVGPYAVPQLFVGPGQWSVGMVVNIPMAPKKMPVEWLRQVWYPGDQYDTLNMTVNTRPLQQLFYGAPGASLAMVNSQIQVISRRQPDGWALKAKAGTPLWWYQRTSAVRNHPITQAEELSTIIPNGGALERIKLFCYDSTTVAPEDGVVATVGVDEEASSIFAPIPWQRWRSQNHSDEGLGDIMASFGRVKLPWCRWGQPSNALDMREWTKFSKTLTVKTSVPVPPVSPKGLDITFNRFMSYAASDRTGQ